MTNREAIKLLKTILRTVYLGNRKFDESIQMAISALEKQEEDRWIPVTERLPEVGQSVMITVAGIYTAEGCLKDVGILDADDIETVFGMVSSADVVPVVRCKNCNYHSFDAESGRWWCNLTSGVRKVNHDDFCSEGKRKGT